MTDFYEIDFLDVEAAKSGDAIAVRYGINGQTYIHVVDGGYIDTGDKMVAHIRKYYGNPSYIDRVIVTHPDGDHANGLRAVLEAFDVGELWMLCPWDYAEEIIDRFETYNSPGRLRSRLREIYSNLAALEDIAIEKNISIFEPFQGAAIGPFTVLAPSKERYLDMVVESERTPESVEEAQEDFVDILKSGLGTLVKAAVNLLKSAWGEEVFSPNETSAENEMSVVQFARLCGYKILLTGDVGRTGLHEAADYAPHAGLNLPGIDKMQVPHHGSRRNVSTEVLDRWLGERLSEAPEKTTFQAYISSAKADPDHPRNSVIRAFIHRGAAVYQTEGQSIQFSCNAPARNWSPLTPVAYPEEQEE